MSMMVVNIVLQMLEEESRREQQQEIGADNNYQDFVDDDINDNSYLLSVLQSL